MWPGTKVLAQGPSPLLVSALLRWHNFSAFFPPYPLCGAYKTNKQRYIRIVHAVSHVLKLRWNSLNLEGNTAASVPFGSPWMSAVFLRQQWVWWSSSDSALSNEVFAHPEKRRKTLYYCHSDSFTFLNISTWRMHKYTEVHKGSHWSRLNYFLEAAVERNWKSFCLWYERLL